VNLEQFYEVAKFLTSQVSHHKIEEKYRAVSDAIDSQIDVPDSENLQAVSTAIDKLRAAFKESELASLPHSSRIILEELEIGEFFSDYLPGWVSDQVRGSGALLNEAQKAIADDLASFSGHLRHLESIVESFEYLEIGSSKLDPGAAELSFFIPREIFENDVESLSRNLIQFDRFVGCCSEIANGKHEDLKLRSITTSDPLLIAVAAPATVLFVLKAVNSILDAYKKVVEIRKLKLEVGKLELSKDIQSALDDEAKSLIENQIQEFLFKIKSDFQVGKKESDQNELLARLENHLMFIAAKIDKGARVDGWAEPEVNDPEQSEEPKFSDAEAINEIREIGIEMTKFVPSKEPVFLLPAPSHEEDK